MEGTQGRTFFPYEQKEKKRKYALFVI